MAAPRRHHYIPQWLSKRWISAPEISRVFGVTKEREGKVIMGWTATPNAVCWERNEYTIVNEAGKRDATLESEFYSRMDTELNTAIKEIVELVEKGVIPIIDEETRKGLAHSLVIDSARRNPDQKTVITEMAQNPNFKAAILSRLPEKFTMEEAEEMYDKLAYDEKHMKMTTNKARRSLLPKGLKSLTEQPFQYVRPPRNKTFVLGNPLVRSKNTHVVPIDPRVAIVFRAASEPSIGTLTRQQRNEINKEIFASSSRVIATSCDYLKCLTGRQGKTLTFTSETDRPRF